MPSFTPVEDSLFLTLCSRALDNRLPRRCLGDEVADEIVRTLDYDYAQFKLSKNFSRCYVSTLEAKRRKPEAHPHQHPLPWRELGSFINSGQHNFCFVRASRKKREHQQWKLRLVERIGRFNGLLLASLLQPARDRKSERPVEDVREARLFAQVPLDRRLPLAKPE